jgi:UDP-GlcNAc:undecaprenyl-phosphate GlcNAc-1-phosphate transferase
MVDIYVLTLAISIGLGGLLTAALLLASRTERLFALFHVRGVEERPRWGGVVFLATFALTPFIASAFSEQASEIFTPRSGNFAGLLAAAAMVFVVGFIDDVRQLGAGVRSLVFAVGGAAVYAAGYRLDDIGLPVGPDVHLGAFGGFTATVAWIWLTTSAINLIDGRDGAALGVAIFAAITLAAIAAHSHHPTVALLLVTLAGAGLGFLPWNLPPASAFIGDSGAYVLGFVIGTLAIRGATGPSDAVFVAVPVVALGYPLLDIGLAFVRRLLHGRLPMLRDEDHIHHRLEHAGAGPRGLLVIIYGIAAVFSLGAILLHYVDAVWMEGAVFAALLATVGITLFRLGYIVTLWNSHSVVWLRQRVFAPDLTAGSSPSGGEPGRRE